jgi:hypothetical protein
MFPCGSPVAQKLNLISFCKWPHDMGLKSSSRLKAFSIVSFVPSGADHRNQLWSPG